MSERPVEYKISEIRVPSVTEVLSILGDVSLLKWANRLGFSFVDVSKHLDEVADIGTKVHAIIAKYLSGEEIGEISDEQISMYFKRFLEFAKEYKIEPIYIEKPMVSNKYLYGGTLDLYCKLNGVYALVDFKTGFFKYKHRIQLSAYKNMLLENGCIVERCYILSLKENGEKPYNLVECWPLDNEFVAFLGLLQAYRVIKEHEYIVNSDEI